MSLRRFAEAVLFLLVAGTVSADHSAHGSTLGTVVRDPADIPPPIARLEPATVRIELTIEEVTAELADGTTFPFWTFGGTVPGPLLRVMEGDTVELTLTNPLESHMVHNIDLHAVNGPGGGAPETVVAPGESKTFSFTPQHAGAFMYHCAYPPVWRHVGQGMYGAIVVEPRGGLPEVDREFYVMQGEWYTSGEFGASGHQAFDPNKALHEDPEYFTFNGHVDALKEIHPLQARPGDAVRLFFGTGGPNIGSNFHVIGEVFDKVYTGSPETYVRNEETWYVPPGSVATFELEVDRPGDYLLVDHALTRVARGAAGVLHVTVAEPSTGAFSLLALACLVLRRRGRGPRCSWREENRAMSHSRATLWTRTVTLVWIIVVTARPVCGSHIPNSIAEVFDNGAGGRIPYHLFLPPGHDDPSRSFPLVLFLHGAGERGNDNLVQASANISGLILAMQSTRFAAYLLTPQVPSSSHWFAEREITMELLEHVVQDYGVDANRLYVTGLSMGGSGTYEFVARDPGRFAAAVPMSGGGNPADAPLLKDVPTWIFHGAMDDIVPVEFSRAMNQALLETGGLPRYTELPLGTHGIWPTVYRDADNVLYPWLFNQSTDRTQRRLEPIRLYNTLDNDSDGLFDHHGDAALDVSLELARAVGEADSGSTNQTIRTLAKFELPPELAPRVRRATLRFYLEEIQGSPPGAVSLFHGLADNDLQSVQSDYEDPAYVDTLLDLVEPESPAGTYHELDVTDLVLADYMADGPQAVSAFRLQVSEAEFVEDNLSHRYRFTMTGSDANRPQLVLTLVPEPGSWILILSGLAAFLFCRRNRSESRPRRLPAASNTARGSGTDLNTPPALSS